MAKAAHMTMDVSGLKETLANLDMLDKRVKGRILRIVLAKGASMVASPAKDNAVAAGYESLRKAIGVQLGRSKRSGAFAKIGAFKGRRPKGDRNKRRKSYLTSTGREWVHIFHLIEFGTKPHAIPFKKTDPTKTWQHPGTQATPILRPAWDANHNQAQDAMGKKLYEEIGKALIGVK